MVERVVDGTGAVADDGLGEAGELNAVAGELDPAAVRTSGDSLPLPPVTPMRSPNNPQTTPTTTTTRSREGVGGAGSGSGSGPPTSGGSTCIHQYWTKSPRCVTGIFAPPLPRMGGDSGFTVMWDDRPTREGKSVMAEIYVSVDIEADGPVPVIHSMISLGAAAFTAEGELVDTFGRNLEPLEGASPDPDTTAWWDSQPEEVRLAARCDARPAGEVMTEFDGWVRALEGTPVFVAYPAGFDFTFVDIYLHLFTGGSPFRHSAFDMKTAAMLLGGVDYHEADSRLISTRWPSEQRHTHVALDDAIEHGQQFVAMLAETRRRLS